MGRTHRKQYRIVVAEKKRHVSKKSQVTLGHYDPVTKELVVKKELAQKYIDARIEMSPKVTSLFKQIKLID